jgi:hypothetical protein
MVSIHYKSRALPSRTSQTSHAGSSHRLHL